MLFSIMATQIYIPTSSAQSFPFLPIFANTYYFFAFDNSHSNRYKVIPHCGFDLQFLDD